MKIFFKHLLIQLSILISIWVSFAAWNTLVTDWQTLTSGGWNDMVNKLISIDGDLTNLNSNMLKYCWENDNCTGTVKLCWARSPDSQNTVSSDDFTITFWSWSNTQCGTSWTGWHVAGSGYSSCSTGAGTKYAVCDWVLVQ